MNFPLSFFRGKITIKDFFPILEIFPLKISIYRIGNGLYLNLSKIFKSERVIKGYREIDDPMIFGERSLQASEILKAFLLEKQVRISYPTAIYIIASCMGVREDTARKYLDHILLTQKDIKTNYWELWLNIQP